jgi:hypothetical protein
MKNRVVVNNLEKAPMKNISKKQKILILVGIWSLAMVGILLHYHFDLVAGLALGVGASTILIGIKKTKGTCES